MKKQNTKTAGNGSALAPGRDFPSLLRRMQADFDGLLEQFTDNWAVSRNGETNGWRWDLEMEDKDDALVVRADAPGFECGDFDVQVKENPLVLRATRKTENKKNNEEYVEQRKCYESIPLPSGIEKEKIEAPLSQWRVDGVPSKDHGRQSQAHCRKRLICFARRLLRPGFRKRTGNMKAGRGTQVIPA